MTDKTPSKNSTDEAKKTPAELREERLREALRANLRRRKAQGRARRDTGPKAE